MLDSGNKDFKTAITNMFKDFKETIFEWIKYNVIIHQLEIEMFIIASLN